MENWSEMVAQRNTGEQTNKLNTRGRNNEPQKQKTILNRNDKKNQKKKGCDCLKLARSEIHYAVTLFGVTWVCKSQKEISSHFHLRVELLIFSMFLSIQDQFKSRCIHWISRGKSKLFTTHSYQYSSVSWYRDELIMLYQCFG